MPKKKSSNEGGMMSSAGLMRYYEADKRAIHLDPKPIVIFGLAIGVGILALNASFGLWP
ncbi:preprotein translocase subunit Sec61beta [Methanohalobium sp.]|uniref:preprotein translocase subunit Sec61beta n=1 Tax=Methanohalobium sp. TaxID=2837493 RepID=UPI0025D5926B|nr:preprotein translocase subunit Sec61beta [Methanohalobium sp.]